MAKATKTTATEKPRFENGTIIREPSLVTDANGVAWWVDPFKQTVQKVTLR